MNGYFDNAASMQVMPQALLDTLSRHKSGNPSSNHHAGQQVRRQLTETRKRVADYLACPAEQIFFTSGATEAANLIIQGYLTKLSSESSVRNEILVSAIEHPAVYQTVHAMAEFGYKIHVLPVDNNGRVDLDAAIALLSPRTAMLCIMAVNNETGAVQPVNQLARSVKQFDPDIMVLSDAVQHFAKLDWQLDLNAIDALFMSGHKIGADKGTGCFYLNSKFKLMPVIHGGSQEQAYRPGTENVFGINLLGEALKENLRNQAERLKEVENLGERLVSNLQKQGVKFQRIIPKEFASPYIVSLAFPGVPARQMMADLTGSGFSVSAGSACSSHVQTPSRILSAMQLSNEIINSTIRFSFSFANTMHDIDCLSACIASICQAECNV